MAVFWPIVFLRSVFQMMLFQLLLSNTLGLETKIQLFTLKVKKVVLKLTARILTKKEFQKPTSSIQRYDKKHKGDQMNKLIILTGILFTLSGRAEIWEPPPYQPDENHLPPEVRQQREEEKPSHQSKLEEKEDKKEQKVDKDKNKSQVRPLSPNYRLI